MPHLLPAVFLLLLHFLSQLPYIMREMGPNGFPLSIGRAADVLYIKLRPLWTHTDNVIFVTVVVLQNIYDSGGRGGNTVTVT